MSRCKDFYRKWERDPNWCEKCPSAVSQINSYIDLVDELKKRGVPPDFTFVKLSESAARPLFTIRDEDIKEKVISSISNALESGKYPITGQFCDKLTEKDVRKVYNSIPCGGWGYILPKESFIKKHFWGITNG